MASNNWLHLLSFGLISLSGSRRQPTVALSTTEAVYIASADATRQAIWLPLLFDGLQFGLGQKPFPIANDNAGTIALPITRFTMKSLNILDSAIPFCGKRLRRMWWIEENLVDLLHVASTNKIAERSSHQAFV